MRPIDADALKAHIDKLPALPDGNFAGTHSALKALINMQPTIDAVPVVRGKWIIHKPFDSGRHNCNECIECSVCGTWFGHDCYEISNFCPNCGADMRQTGDENV